MSMDTFEVCERKSHAVIKVVGVGGGGGNAVEDMIKSGEIQEVEFICVNTDRQALERSSASTVWQLGEELTKGLGAGADPNVGRQAAEADRIQIAELLQGCDMLFLAVGEGGGTGSGAAPVIAEIAKEQGILTVAVVTKPFGFEGRRRLDVANAGIEALSQHVDSLITIPNDKLLTVLGKDVSLLSAFKAANSVLQGAVKGISDLITRPGLINVDFADVCAVMSKTGNAMMGTGRASGPNRALEAAEQAISSPLLEHIDLQEAEGVLVNLTGGPGISIGEFETVGDTIRRFTSDNATVVVGTAIDMDMIEGDEELSVTVVVTGLSDGGSRPASVKPRNESVVSGLLNQAVESVQPKVDVTVAPIERPVEKSVDTAPLFEVVETEQQQAPIVEPSLHEERYTLRRPMEQAPEPPIVEKEELSFLDIPAFLRREKQKELES